MKSSDFYDYLRNKNVDIIKAPLKDVDGLCIDESVVLLPNDINKRSEQEQVMILAEETAHYEVGTIPSSPFNTDYQNKLIHSKNEFRAFKWMQEKLIPSDLKKFRNDTLWEIADEFNVSIEFVEKVLNYRKENSNEKKRKW